MKPFEEVGIGLNDLLTHMDMLVQVVDPQGRLLYINDHWLACLGYSDAESIGQDFVGWLMPQSHELWRSCLQRAMHGGRVDGVLMLLKHHEGEPIVVEGRLIPRIQNGAVQNIVCVWRDVTERQHRQDELERIFMLSVDMLGAVDFAGSFLKLNPACERILGYHPQEMIGKHLLDFVHPEDVERTLEASSQALHGATLMVFENRYRTKDGRYRWLSWNVTPDFLHHQTYFVARDVTERKQSEEALYKAKELLQAVLDHSVATVTLKDSYGRYILANQQYLNMLQLSDALVIGQSDYEIFAPHIADQLHSHDTRVLETGEAYQVEEWIPIGESLHTFLANKFPLLDSQGHIYAVCTIATDITYRKLTEMQLLLRNKAIENSPTGISIADVSLPDMPLIYVNEAFERTTGYAALEVIGRNCRFLQGSEREQAGVLLIREALKAQKPITVVLRNYRKDGTLFYNELSLAPIHNEDGRLTHYVGISTDVTQRVLTDEKMQAQNEALLLANRELAIARKQAEDATRLKSQFLATISHELRTPLNAITGYTQIHLAGWVGDVNEEQRDYLGRVLVNAKHLLQLINDVLDLSKIEAGRMEIVQKPFHVRDWAQEIIAQTQGLAAEKALAFEVQLDERMPQAIVGDAARLTQIVLNLLSNAIKFTERGSVKLAIRLHGDAWKLTVTDTGIGIPSHLQETIFEEFRQVDSSSQRQHKGTGLGLSIVRKLTLMMGGNIRLNSKVGEGSTFLVVLPLILPKDSVG